jgi:DNA-binding MarR family transcriptional regulator
MRAGSSVLLPWEKQRPSAAARKRWRDARLFQRDVGVSLARERVSFMEWLLLETLHELRDETRDAVSQSAIARRAGLPRKIVSYWMIIMSEQGLVDRGPSSEGGAWRIILSDLGETTLRRCNERLEQAGLSG